MSRYTIKQELTMGPVGKTGKTPSYLRWILRENGKQIGEFHTEQEAMVFRDKLVADSSASEKE